MLSLVNVVTSDPSDCSVYNNGALLGVTMYPEIIDQYTHNLRFVTYQDLEDNKVTLAHSLIYEVTVRNDSNLDNPYVVNNLVTNPVLNLGDDTVDQVDFVGLGGIYAGSGSLNIRILVHLFDFLEDDPLIYCAIY
ncbi:31698_t:CDS:1 [Gigaspora margarita]|uniref:31698_t:CDS:1 n=1 Tax=Gigaspora margarita TaxID=4874 RepID=A0ABN7UJ44_GIGMA|nr:31698_t:CDS:1 [Gigaspora margarita]